MAQGCFLPLLFKRLEENITPHPVMLYGPCEYWSNWHHSLPADLKKKITPCHYPLSQSVGYDYLSSLSCPLILSAQTITLLDIKDPSVALWFYEPQRELLLLTLAQWPMTLLTLENWLLLSQIASNVSALFFEKGLPLSVSSLNTGSLAKQQFLALKSNFPQKNSVDTGPVLLEPLEFHTSIPYLRNTSPAQKKGLFAWLSDKEKKQPKPCLYGSAHEKSVLAFSAGQSQQELTAALDWALTAAI